MLEKSPLGGCGAPHYSTSHHHWAFLVSVGLHLGVQRLRGAPTPDGDPAPCPSMVGGPSPTGGVSPPGSSANPPRETESLAAHKSGAFQEFLGGVATCRLGSANLASPQLAGLDAREMFRFLLCHETVMATRSALQGEQTTKPQLRGLGLVYFCFSKGKNTPLHSGNAHGDKWLHGAHGASSRAPPLQP